MIMKPIKQTLFISMMALTLSACAGLPQTHISALEGNPHLSSAADTADRYHIDGEWWQIYGDSKLNALVNQALANNIDLKKAAVHVNKALYQANILGANLVPSFNGSAGASDSRNLKSGDSQNSFSSRLGVSYELDLWQRLSKTASAQIWEYQATAEDLAKTRLTLLNNITDVYFQIAYLNEAIDLTEQSIARYEEINRISASKYRLGKVNANVPVQAQQALLAAKNNLLTLQNSRNTAQQTLRNLLNLKPNEAPAADPTGYRLAAAKGVDLNVPVSTLANRPDLRAAEYRLQSSLQSLEAQKLSWYPSITVGASLSSSSDKARTLFDVPFLGGSVQLNLPFLDWKTLKWKDKAAEADFDSARLNFEQTLTSALNEVHTYYADYLNAETALGNLRQRYVLDQKNSRYYQVRYQYGKNELKDWLEALNTEYGTAQNLLNQRYQTLKAENRIYQVMAGRYSRK
ncbi:TolC family protein [Neisseria lisongii]|uniref:TolC family protein n=1 Tax=Neisseria lisongii TaxID=2912188 RepID=A0AAW5AN96_9NEIS|nr:TolC family protein [Neisseria lisongii]